MRPRGYTTRPTRVVWGPLQEESPEPLSWHCNRYRCDCRTTAASLRNGSPEPESLQICGLIDPRHDFARHRAWLEAPYTPRCIPDCRSQYPEALQGLISSRCRSTALRPLFRSHQARPDGLQRPLQAIHATTVVRVKSPLKKSDLLEDTPYRYWNALEMAANWPSGGAIAPAAVAAPNVDSRHGR